MNKDIDALEEAIVFQKQEMQEKQLTMTTLEYIDEQYRLEMMEAGLRKLHRLNKFEESWAF